jgi:hypothetical protein
MILIIPGYHNSNILVKWLNSHQHLTCVYMGTVLLPFLYIIEQSKTPNSVSQSSPTHVFLLSRLNIVRFSLFQYLPNDMRACPFIHVWKYCQTVRREALTPAIREYIMQQNAWTPAIMDMIHWEAHGQALSKNFIHRTFLVKLIHDKLPVGKTIARYQATYDHRCPSCQEEHKDRTHFLRCPDPVRVSWQLTRVLQFGSDVAKSRLDPT